MPAYVITGTHDTDRETIDAPDLYTAALYHGFALDRSGFELDDVKRITYHHADQGHFRMYRRVHDGAGFGSEPFGDPFHVSRALPEDITGQPVPVRPMPEEATP